MGLDATAGVEPGQGSLNVVIPSLVVDKAGMPPELNPVVLSRRLKRIHAVCRGWEQTLSSGAEVSELPLRFFRQTLSREQFAAIAELPDVDPLRKATLRWLFRLIERRVNEQWLVRQHYLFSHATHPIDALQIEFSLQQLWAMLLQEPQRRKSVQQWLTRHSSQFCEARAEVAGRRMEIAERMGVPEPLELEAPGDDVVELAQDWLKDTRDVFRTLAVHSVDDWLNIALDSCSGVTWPGRLSESNLAGWFSGTRLLEGLELETAPLPPALGAASFLRGLETLGRGLRRDTSASVQPFVLARDPYELDVHCWGTLFMGLAWNPEFGLRNLELSRARDDFPRLMARLWLMESRVRALKVVLRRCWLESRSEAEQRFETLAREELGMDWSGATLGVAFRLRNDDAQRFGGFFAAQVMECEMIERHDEDWFRNPRAVDELRTALGSPPSVQLEASVLSQGQDLLRQRLLAVLA